jgi:CheY-like chemotaxis protein
MSTNVLLAEEDPLLRETWAVTLQRLRFDIDQTQGRRETLYRFCMQPPDVAVISLDLPTADNIRMLRLMAQFHPSCPLVILAPEADGYENIARPGIDILIKKPFDVSQLIQALQRIAAHQPKSDGAENPPEEPPFVISPRGGGRHYRKKSAGILRAARAI